MDEKMFRDYIVLESRLKESNLTIDEMSYDLNNLENYQRDLLEIIDEKNKDIADLHRELREVKEKLSKSESYNGNH
jgi:DNA gyrase/topoisomerase IV subunit A